MLRVLTLSTLFPDQSRPRFGPFVERQTMELAAHPDVELRVFAPLGLPPWPLNNLRHYAPFTRVPKQEDWKSLCVSRPRFRHLPGTGGRFDPAMMARAVLPHLKALRADFAFDVIDAEFFFPDGPAAVRLGKALGVPVSIKARGADIYYWGASPATRQQVIGAGRQADGLLAVSSALKSDMVEMGMPEDRIRVHHTGVDLSLFKPLDRAAAKATLGVAGPLIASVGALIERKGQALLVESLPLLPGATLALIGQGPDRVSLERSARAHGVADRVIFVGSAAHEEVAQWLGAADCMALPSASEGLANVWVEALACGTPVVTCDVGGAREAISGPVLGHLVARNPEAIVHAIHDLIDHPRDPLAVRKAAEKFTWAANTATLYDHLKSLI
jgi:teichuronic acid biosynthesis glycosyltransferase TuaC